MREMRPTNPKRYRSTFCQTAVGCLLSLGVVLAGGGCLSLSKAAPVKRRFGLETEPAVATAPGSGFSLLVRDLASSSVYDGRGLIYRTGELTYDTDFYHEFFAPPAVLLTGELRRWFRGAGLFQTVLGPGSYADHQYVLEGEILDLYGDYRGSRGMAVVGLNLLLLREQEGGADLELCFQREFRRGVELEDDEVDTLVRGLHAALAGVLEEAEQAVRREVGSS